MYAKERHIRVRTFIASMIFHYVHSSVQNKRSTIYGILKIFHTLHSSVKFRLQLLFTLVYSLFCTKLGPDRQGLNELIFLNAFLY